MNTRPRLYSRFSHSQLILRDELAIDRTLLANERTLLAYLRSGVALLIAGATMIHFSQHDWFMAVGVTCIPLGLACTVFGLIRFVTVRRNIRLIRGQLPSVAPDDPNPPAAAT